MQTSLPRSDLAELEAFVGLAPSDVRVRELELSRRDFDVSRGRFLFMEGEPRRYVYYLVEGRIKLSRISRSGRECILELVEPGEIFGESSLLDPGTHECDGVAFDDSRVVALPSRELRQLMTRGPELPLRVAQLVDRRRRRVARRLASLALQDTRGRLASLLVQLCRDYGVPGNEGIRLGIELRHRELASLIGASREIVCNTLSDFRREGLVGSSGRSLVVRRALMLERIQELADAREEVSS